MYECHITCRVKDAAKCDAIAAELHWKTSEIKRDPVLGDDSYYYLTSHYKDEPGMFSRLDIARVALRMNDVEIVREKIEHIVYDTKATK